MYAEHRLAQRPLILGLAAILAVVLGFAALVGFGGSAFAQTGSTATPSATTTSSISGANAAASASPTAPTTGSGVADGGSSSSAIILIGGLVVVGGSLAAMGYSLRKNS
jgi:hypothetical protein